MNNNEIYAKNNEEEEMEGDTWNGIFNKEVDNEQTKRKQKKRKKSYGTNGHQRFINFRSTKSALNIKAVKPINYSPHNGNIFNKVHVSYLIWTQQLHLELRSNGNQEVRKLALLVSHFTRWNHLGKNTWFSLNTNKDTDHCIFNKVLFHLAVYWRHSIRHFQ